MAPGTCPRRYLLVLTVCLSPLFPQLVRTQCNCTFADTDTTCACPPGFTQWQGSAKCSCYRMEKSDFRSWPAARNRCRSLSPCADLVALDEPLEKYWLQKIYLPSVGAFTDNSFFGMWTGGIKDSGGNFKWVSTNAAFSRTDPSVDMHPSQPDGDGNCFLKYKPFPDAQLGDYPCSIRQPFICELVPSKKVTPAECKCAPPFQTWASSTKGSCHYVSKTTLDWEAAREQCRSMVPCANLAAIDESGEKDWVKSLATGVTTGNWLGAKKVPSTALWKWNVTGEQVTQTDPRNEVFGPGEPNGDGACLTAWRPFSLLWGDYPCDRPLQYTCEITPIPVTTPTAATTTTTSTTVTTTTGAPEPLAP